MANAAAKNWSDAHTVKPGDVIAYSYRDGTQVIGRVHRPFGEAGWFLVDVEDNGHTSREHFYVGDMRHVRTTYDPKPIPLRQYDWEAVIGEYDLDAKIGHGLTEADAIADLAHQLPA